jgi:hypothetical protein
MESFAEHAESNIMVDGAPDAQCRVTSGTTITGLVNVLPKSDISFTLFLVLVTEEESITTVQKHCN